MPASSPRQSLLRLTLFFALACALPSARAMVWPFIPFEQRWESLDIIAIVEVGAVHTVETPEGVVLQSAKARIDQLIYRRQEPPPFRDESGTIKLYSVMPNGQDNGGPTLRSGKAFIMMKQQGFNAYTPTDPWEFQSLAEADRVAWLHQNEIKMLPMDEVIGMIESFIASHPSK